MSQFFKKTAIFAFLFALLTLAAVSVVMADATTSTGETIKLENPLGDKDLAGIIQGVVNFIFRIALIVCPLIIIWGGFVYITSGGNEEKTREGKRIITYAIVGLIIIILANGFVAMIKSVLGVK